MTIAQVAEATHRSPRTDSRFSGRTIVPAIAALLAVGAFLLFGPVGLGNGPLGVPAIDGRFGLSTAQPTVYVATLVNVGGSTAVIDGVTVITARGYAPARVLGVRVAGHSSYGCVYALMQDVAGCARPPFTAPAGFAVAPRANTAPGSRGGPALVIEMAAPPAARCVALTAIVLHYHVGIRQYTATVPQGFVWACGKHAVQPQS
jgi:hypothetical protein